MERLIGPQSIEAVVELETIASNAALQPITFDGRQRHLNPALYQKVIDDRGLSQYIYTNQDPIQVKRKLLECNMYAQMCLDWTIGRYLYYTPVVSDYRAMMDGYMTRQHGIPLMDITPEFILQNHLGVDLATAGSEQIIGDTRMTIVTDPMESHALVQDLQRADHRLPIAPDHFIFDTYWYDDGSGNAIPYWKLSGIVETTTGKQSRFKKKVNSTVRLFDALSTDPALFNVIHGYAQELFEADFAHGHIHTHPRLVFLQRMRRTMPVSKIVMNPHEFIDETESDYSRNLGIHIGYCNGNSR